MSIDASKWAWSQPIENARHKLLLLKLADSANDDGVCWPSVRTLAAHTGISKSSVARMVKALETAGLMWVEERLFANGERGNNVYHLALPGVSHSRAGQGVPLRDGTLVSHSGRDITQSKTIKNHQNQAAARAAAAPEHVGDRKWRVLSSREGKGPFIADLETKRCTCENRSASPCRHLKAAALAEDRAEKARKRDLRDAVWDGLVEAFGKPTEREKKGFGAVREVIVGRLDDEGIRQTPERWKEEVGARFRALAAEWGVGRVTMHGFGQNWHLAGKLLAKSPATTATRQRKYTAASEVE